MDYTLRQMTLDDYDEVYGLWARTDGLSMEEGDSRDAVGLYLKRNRGLCFVAIANGEIVGTVLCGHDGRRGILRHLVVDAASRGQGIARSLVSECLEALAREGITRCNTFVLDTNAEGLRFWEHLGWWMLEDDYRTLQMHTGA